MSRRARLSAMLMVAFAATGSAQAQVAGPGGPPGQMPPCLQEFIKLRDEATRRAGLLRAAGERRAPPQEACKLIQQFQAAETKLIAYAEQNNVWCGIPAEAVKQMKASAVRTQQMRTQACAAAAAPKPRAPSLSDALGTSRAPAPETATTGRGTFDTLTGNPLTR